MDNKKAISSIVINSIIFLVTTGIVVSYFCGNTGTLIEHGYESFKFFTTDSNVIAAAASLCMIVSQIKHIRNKNEIPLAVILLKYVGTVSVMLTFCTVVLFLAPIYGAANVLSGTAFHMHAAAPLLSLISFCFIETDTKLPFRSTFAAIIPMLIYAVVYTANVVFLNTWMDFYSFNMGGYWYFTAPIIIISTYIISIITLLIHNRMSQINSISESKMQK